MSRGMILKKINDYLTIQQLTMQQVHASILSSILQFCCSYGWGGGGSATVSCRSWVCYMRSTVHVAALRTSKVWHLYLKTWSHSAIQDCNVAQYECYSISFSTYL